MIKINIKNDDALKELTQFQIKKHAMCDVRFSNVHLMKMNKKIRYNLFYKNDLFVNSDTLWSLMQDDNQIDSHNHHGLTPKDILDALNNILDPYCVFKSKQGRISIVLSCLSHYGEPLMVVIQIGSDLINKKNAKINKMITMYPKRDIDKSIQKMDSSDLLYVNRLR